jgi:hypothetical protein
MSNKLSIFDLISKHFKKIKNFNVDKHVKEQFNDEVYSHDRFEWDDILPDCEEIAYDDDINIVQYSNECSVKFNRLYQYKKYYIVVKFNNDHCDDMDVWTIAYNYNAFKKYMNNFVKVGLKKDFDTKKFINNSMNLEFLFPVYHQVYGDKGWNKLKLYLESKYKQKIVDDKEINTTEEIQDINDFLGGERSTIEESEEKFC